MNYTMDPLLTENEITDQNPTTSQDTELAEVYHSVPSQSNYLLNPLHIIDSDPISIAERVLSIEIRLSSAVEALKFSKPVTYLYNPIQYAYDLHKKFVVKFCKSPKKILFVGMNPGPWGMSQTGIPFGEVSVVQNWFHLSGQVNRPSREHPARQVLGLDCHRSEVSGKRFWSLFRELCGPDPHNFFQHCFMYNHCPVAFMTDTGKNITPAELKAAESKALFSLCDTALIDVLAALKVETLVGIGKFAEKRATIACKAAGIDNVRVVSIPHPSPRNVGNGNSWKDLTIARLQELELLQLFAPPATAPNS